jgi:hypothetical protein
VADVVHILPGYTEDAARDLVGDEGVFVTSDTLSWGPLPPLLDVADWTARRLAFRRSTGWDRSEDGALISDTSPLLAARRLVLRLENTLDDQLTLAWFPALLRAGGASPAQIDLVQLQGNGITHLRQPEALPAPVTLSPRDLAELTRVWDALVAPEPEALVAELRSDYEPLPLLKRALRALFSLYPERRAGLDASELKLLEESRNGPVKAARVIGTVLGEHHRGADLCGDDWLFARLLRLGDPSLPEPALELTASTEAYRFVTVRLTPFGERILAGEANFIEANGIDDWIAGVHLDSKTGRVWLNDQGRVVRDSRRIVRRE